MSYNPPIKNTEETKKLREHIEYLRQNPPSIETIHNRRLDILKAILKKMEKIIKECKIIKDSITEYKKIFETVQISSFFMSSSWDDIKGRYREQVEAETGKSQKDWSVFYYIVHQIIKSDALAWKTEDGKEMKAFHTDGKQDTYFHCEWDNHTTTVMAAAAQAEKKWVSQLWLARKMTTVKDRKEFKPIRKGTAITMSECWQPGTHKQNNNRNETFEPTTLPGIWFYEKETEYNKIELFKTILVMDNPDEDAPLAEKQLGAYTDLILNKFLWSNGLIDDFGPVECRNLLILIMLLEHELIHAYIAREDQSEDLGITEEDELAKPFSFPRYGWKRRGKTLTEWPKIKKDDLQYLPPEWREGEQRVGKAYTNKAGHGDYFCRLTNLIFAHCGCYSSTDTIQFKTTCEKKTWCKQFTKLQAAMNNNNSGSKKFKTKLIF